MNEEPRLFEQPAVECKSKEQVTVFGITFPNDEERRVYFREELRKKLLELKQLEGFPIGSDEDIINLSDPPYYTACPNPWINDFIDKWENEKKTLLAEGKRNSDVEVKEPYVADVSEGKNNPIYMAHAYHTKVPHPAIMRYILHYTQPGDTVFDGFCGTGMTAVAAQLCGSNDAVKSLNESDVTIGVRHGICSDLAPICSLIAATYTSPLNIDRFVKEANHILDVADKELGWMFTTQHNKVETKYNYLIWSDVFQCPSCGEEIVFWDNAVSRDTKEMVDSFKCPKCGGLCSKNNMTKVWETSFDSLLNQTVSLNKKVPVRINFKIGTKRYEVPVSEYDINLIKKIEDIDLSSYHSVKLVENGFNTSQPIQSNGVTYTHQFYTKRNFIYLNWVFEMVKNNPVLITWFTSAVQNATKMYKFRTDRKGGILNGTLFIPSLNYENNPSKLLRAKIKDIVSTSYLQRGNSVISVASATSLSTISDVSIDYMFIDPPFGANIMYSELNSVWESWLNVQTNNKEEAIVNEGQGKTLFDYQMLMNHSLKEFYRILKPGKWLTMEFSNTSAAVWNSIQNALQGVGFVVVNVAALDKKQGSFKAVTSPTAVKQDLIITCFKPTDELTEKFANSINTDMNVWDFVEELLEHLPVHLQKGQSTTAVVERSPKILFDRLISFYVQHGYNVPISAQAFQKGLKEHFVERDGMYFTAGQTIEYEEKKRNTRDFIQTSLLISNESEGIEWLKRKLEEKQLTYSDIHPMWLQDVVISRKGDKLPELIQILEENFLKNEDGKWRIPNKEKESDLDKLRTRKLLKEFGVYYEMATKPKGKIKEARLEALRVGFKHSYQEKDFTKIVTVGNKLPESLLMEDDVLLQYYDIASSRI